MQIVLVDEKLPDPLQSNTLCQASEVLAGSQYGVHICHASKSFKVPS